MDPILLDQINLVSDWVVEDEAPVDLSWLNEETKGPSGVPFSEMETPNTPASQLIFQSSDVGTSSSRAYTRHYTTRSHARDSSLDVVTLSFLFLFSSSYVLSYVFELGTILECVQGIFFHFTILHRNVECQMLCYQFL